MLNWTITARLTMLGTLYWTAFQITNRRIVCSQIKIWSASYSWLSEWPWIVSKDRKWLWGWHRSWMNRPCRSYRSFLSKSLNNIYLFALIWRITLPLATILWILVACPRTRICSTLLVRRRWFRRVDEVELTLVLKMSIRVLKRLQRQPSS